MTTAKRQTPSRNIPINKCNKKPQVTKKEQPTNINNKEQKTKKSTNNKNEQPQQTKNTNKTTPTKQQHK